MKTVAAAALAVGSFIAILATTGAAEARHYGRHHGWGGHHRTVVVRHYGRGPHYGWRRGHHYGWRHHGGPRHHWR
jgi:hypothetical protein